MIKLESVVRNIFKIYSFGNKRNLQKNTFCHLAIILIVAGHYFGIFNYFAC